MEGWIKLHKKIMEHWMWEDPIILKAWLDILLSVNYTKKKILFDGNLETVEAGQIITSVRKLARRWKCSKERVNKILGMFEQDGMLTVNKTTRRTLLSVVNYRLYQNGSDNIKDSNKDTEQDTEQDTDSPQHKNNKEYKENKEEREEPELSPVKITRFTTGMYDNVYLSNEEAAKLAKELGETVAKKTIDALSEYMYTHKHKYTDDGHYAVLKKWAKEDRRKYSEEEDDPIQRKALAQGMGAIWGPPVAEDLTANSPEPGLASTCPGPGAGPGELAGCLQMIKELAVAPLVQGGRASKASRFPPAPNPSQHQSLFQ